MLRARQLTLFFVPAVLAGHLACVGEEVANDPNAAIEPERNVAATESEVLPPPIVGTFRSEQVVSGVAVLTLKKDWTYHLEEAVQCVRYPCDFPQYNGMFTVAQQRDMSKLLILLDDSGGKSRVFRYTLRGDDLYIARESDWQRLERSDRAWCAIPKDCVLQDLPAGTCEGDWFCGENVCSYLCGPIDTPQEGEDPAY